MSRFVIATAAVAAAALGMVMQACAAEGPPVVPLVDQDSGKPDGATPPDGGPSAGVRVVVVNGLTRNVAVADGGKPARDVRLCFGKAGLALPSTGAMPLASYPGVARGRGLDLGQIYPSPPASLVQIDVLDADAVRLSTADGSCSKLTEPLGGPAAYVPSATAFVDLVAGVNLLVLRDGPSGGLAIEQAVLSGMVTGSPLDAGLDAGPRPIQGQFGVFSTWLAADASVAVDLDDGGGAQLASALRAGEIGPVAAATITLASADPYEVSSLRFTASGKASPADVTQTFGAIQYQSDPTTSPAAFFEQRQSFVFVVIGDPADTTALTADGGRKSGFDGAELHVVAVPYLN